MKQLRKWIGTGGLGVMLLLSACTHQAAPTQPAPVQPAKTKTQSVSPSSHPKQSAGTVIPSVDQHKKTTTNQHGTTYSGMGTSLYSTIGSSGMHGGGPSTNLEARLNAANIHGVQALIVNDAIVIAPSSAKSQSVNHMDPMQAHLISSYAGSSSRGPEGPGTTTGTSGTLGTKDHSHSLAQARTQIARIYGTEAKVWTVTTKKGIDALERVKKNMHDNKQDANMAADIATVMKEAKRQR